MRPSIWSYKTPTKTWAECGAGWLHRFMELAKLIATSRARMHSPVFFGRSSGSCHRGGERRCDASPVDGSLRRQRFEPGSLASGRPVHRTHGTGNRSSGQIARHEDSHLTNVERGPDLTLCGLRDLLHQERRLRVSTGTLRCFSDRHGVKLRN